MSGKKRKSARGRATTVATTSASTTTANRAQRALRGLTTVALLKTNFDERRDHIAMFEPFVFDAIRELPTDNFSIDAIGVDLYDRFGLTIPLATLRTLLNRPVHQHLLRRQGGRYFRLRVAPSEPGIHEKRVAIEREHATLAKRLIEFAAERNRVLDDEGEALTLLLAFLAVHHVWLLLDGEVGETAPASAISRADDRLLAGFIQTVCLKDPALSGYLDRMLQGFVLQNTLLLKDIATSSRRFLDLTVFIDSGFLLGIVGLKGQEIEITTTETIRLLKESHARLAVFDRTMDEVGRILHMYERKLATAEGRRLLQQTDITRFFLTNSWTPSDVRQAAALLETRVTACGIQIVPTPPRQPELTFDEADLAQRLCEDGADPHGPRATHDVDCVAAVLTKRAGKKSNSLDDAVAVFATSTNKVARTVRDWYMNDEHAGIPPIIHYAALANIAWLKRPAATADHLQLHQLVATCTAALRPRRKTWAAFLEHLRKLEADQSLTTDEAVAIVASKLTDTLLASVDTHDDPDAASLTEVVERVKADYRQDADDRIALARSEAATVVQQSRERERDGVDTLHEIARRWDDEAERRAVRGSLMISGAAGAVTIAAEWLSVPGVLDHVHGVSHHAAILCAILFSIGSGVALIWGGSVAEWGKKLRRWLFRRHLARLAGLDHHRDPNDKAVVKAP